jgi:hypothetical protein
MAHNSGVLGSASTETWRLFKVNETMCPPLVCRLPARCRFSVVGWDARTA